MGVDESSVVFGDPVHQVGFQRRPGRFELDQNPHFPNTAARPLPNLVLILLRAIDFSHLLQDHRRARLLLLSIFGRSQFVKAKSFVAAGDQTLNGPLQTTQSFSLLCRQSVLHRKAAHRSAVQINFLLAPHFQRQRFTGIVQAFERIVQDLEANRCQPRLPGHLDLQL